MDEQLKSFYDFLFTNKKPFYRSCNTIRNGVFSKNIFVREYKEFKTFVDMCEDQDSYINYQPLKTNENRKTINVARINVIALDIEMVDKQRPETQKNMEWMVGYIKYYLELHNITNYLLVNSGNGYHLYLRFYRSKEITDENLDVFKNVYKKVVDDINREIRKYCADTISLDDRKDIAGILRIPGTTNTKAKKRVTIVDMGIEGDNRWLTYLWGKYLRIENKKKKFFNNNQMTLTESLDGIELPKNIKELIKSPLLKIRMDETLPEPKENEWHKTIVFALQALVYHSGLSKHPMINEISLQYNRKCNCQIDLSECSYKSDFSFPIRRALWFCKKNGYKQYEKEIKEMYLK